MAIIPSVYINEPIVGAVEIHSHTRTRCCHIEPSFQEIVEDIQRYFMQSDYERMAPLHFPQTSSSESANYKYKTLRVQSSERTLHFKECKSSKLPSICICCGGSDCLLCYFRVKIG